MEPSSAMKNWRLGMHLRGLWTLIFVMITAHVVANEGDVRLVPPPNNQFIRIEAWSTARINSERKRYRSIIEKGERKDAPTGSADDVDYCKRQLVALGERESEYKQVEKMLRLRSVDPASFNGDMYYRIDGILDIPNVGTLVSALVLNPSDGELQTQVVLFDTSGSATFQTVFPEESTLTLHHHESGKPGSIETAEGMPLGGRTFWISAGPEASSGSPKVIGIVYKLGHLSAHGAGPSSGQLKIIVARPDGTFQLLPTIQIGWSDFGFMEDCGDQRPRPQGGLGSRLLIGDVNGDGYRDLVFRTRLLSVLSNAGKKFGCFDVVEERAFVMKFSPEDQCLLPIQERPDLLDTLRKRGWMIHSRDHLFYAQDNDVTMRNPCEELSLQEALGAENPSPTPAENDVPDR